jgi:DNA-binding LacI/PurR family transcriptional regulator
LAGLKLIEEHLLPSAIFAAGDMLAIGVMKAYANMPFEFRKMWPSLL